MADEGEAAASFAAAFDGADFVFSESELNHILGLIERVPDAPVTEPVAPVAAGLPAQLGLQFQPRTGPDAGNVPVGPSTGPVQPHLIPSQLPPQAAAAVAQIAAAAAAAAQASAAWGAAPVAGGAKAGAVPPGGVSHSLVEKARRDRLNNLIDELRDIVPPAARPGAPPMDAGEAARRPKHVVLADTIALVKQLTTQFSLHASMAEGAGLVPAAQAQPQQQQQQQQQQQKQQQQVQAVAIKEEVTCSDASKGSASSGRVEGAAPEAAGAPQLPHIPCHPTPNAGVTVEQGPAAGVYYVQVKCRDRKGLLSDIINSLRQLPLEIRTAAVTTTPDGRVVDVFEVHVEDAALRAEELQNMVHEALFEPQQEPLNTNAKRTKKRS